MTNDERQPTNEELSAAHFARVAPIVGPSLRGARVALIGLPAAAPIAAYLAACGVGRWLWAADLFGGSATTALPGWSMSAEALRSSLDAQHGAALALNAILLPARAWAAAIRCDPPDLVIAVGGSRELALALETASFARVPALLVMPPTATSPYRALAVLPGDDLSLGRYDPPAACCDLLSWDWVTSAPLCAGLARAILLRETPFGRADMAELWAAGMRVLTIGPNADPLAVEWSAPSRSEIHTPGPKSFRTPAARRGTLLIAGLGSLGSVAATLLASHAGALVLADHDHVDACNPARQAYTLASIGQPKAQALRAILAPSAGTVIALDIALADEREVVALANRYAITAALVVTGTAADFAIARALRACDIPHVVGRCYPRARYWEAIVVDGRRGPAFSDLRGHLPIGPAPAPTPEQSAAYSDAGSLEAEPATLIESGWAAAWMARLAAQLLVPAGLRERWLLEPLAAGRTCLIGGVGVERTPGGPAYGVATPGEIHAWGQDGIRVV